MFTVRITQFIFFGADDVTMELTVQLPFPPYAGMSIGLYADSGFNADEEVLERVIFLTSQQLFHAQVKHHRCCKREIMMSSIGFLIAKGWRPSLGGHFQSAESADECDPGFYFVVRVGNDYCSCNRLEVECLTLSKIQHEIVMRPTVGPMSIEE